MNTHGIYFDDHPWKFAAEAAHSSAAAIFPGASISVDADLIHTGESFLTTNAQSVGPVGGRALFRTYRNKRHPSCVYNEDDDESCEQSCLASGLKLKSFSFVTPTGYAAVCACSCEPTGGESLFTPWDFESISCSLCAMLVGLS